MFLGPPFGFNSTKDLFILIKDCWSKSHPWDLLHMDNSRNFLFSIDKNTVCFAEMNAKGVILKAFEQYRLKTCIDFKPWQGEKNFISVFKGSG